MGAQAHAFLDGRPLPRARTPANSSQDGRINMTNVPATTSYAGQHVDVRSAKAFDDVVKDLQAELGSASTEKLMDRLASSATWDEYAEECAGFAGRSNLIEVGLLNWGRALTLAGIAMRAKCFIVGNPLTARKLLEAGGPEVGLHLPTKIYVFEDADGATHVAYDKFAPIMASYANHSLSKIADIIDDVLARLAAAAAD